MKRCKKWTLPSTAFTRPKSSISCNIFDDMERVRELGGLHVIGSERHEARRIDNQLRGRAARQGDPGSSRFYLSLEDDLMRMFGGEQVKGVMERFSIDEDYPLQARLVTNMIEQFPAPGRRRQL